MSVKEVLIDNVHYVFEFSGSEISFYIDPYKSKRHIEVTAEEIETDIFDDDPHEIHLYRRVPVDAPIAVYREAIKFAHNMIGKHRPHHFSYCAEEKTRWGIYERAGHKMAKIFGYNVYSWADGEVKRWEFYKDDPTTH